MTVEREARHNSPTKHPGVHAALIEPDGEAGKAMSPELLRGGNPPIVTALRRRAGGGAVRGLRRRAFSYVALIPATVFVLGLLIVPIFETFYHSFTNWDGISSNFIGLGNYRLL